MATTGNKPVFKRNMKGVHVAVFANALEKGTSYNTTLQRVYKRDDQFERTTNLWRDDLPVAMLLLQDAYRFICEAESKRNGGGDVQPSAESDAVE